MSTNDEKTLIRNRDIPKLQRVYYIMQDIVSLENRRDWQKDRMTNITSHLSGMPGGGGAKGGMEDAFARISDIEEKHRLLVKKYTRELRHAEQIINGIENENMRTFVMMMYVDNIPAVEVRERLNMTRRGFERAKTSVEQAVCMRDVVWHERYILDEKDSIY